MAPSGAVLVNKHNLGQSRWLRRYVEPDAGKKKPERGPVDQKRAERKRQLDLIADARQLGNELGEVWDND
jgi:hypothetical protein